jgi:hypothetical protein
LNESRDSSSPDSLLEEALLSPRCLTLREDFFVVTFLDLFSSPDSSDDDEEDDEELDEDEDDAAEPEFPLFLAFDLLFFFECVVSTTSVEYSE